MTTDKKVIDLPIKLRMARMNALGFETKCSCCGFHYIERSGKHHRPKYGPYVLFSCDFELVDLLFKTLVEAEVDEVTDWDITFEGENHWKLRYMGRRRQAFWLSLDRALDMVAEITGEC